MWGERGRGRAVTGGLGERWGRDDGPVLSDTGGGGVGRRRPPDWPALHAESAFDALYEVAPSSAIKAARTNGQALVLMLGEVGVNVNCAPLLDVRMPDIDGLEVQRELRARGITLPVEIMTGHGDVYKAVAAMKTGARDLIEQDRKIRAQGQSVNRGCRLITQKKLKVRQFITFLLS